MPLRLFVDHCVPRSVGEALAANGHLVLLLRDHLPPDAPDEAVIAKAQELDAILVSINGDFADIVTYPPAVYRGIIALQVRNHPESAAQVIERLAAYFGAHPDPDEYVGRLLIIEPHRIRVRS